MKIDESFRNALVELQKHHKLGLVVEGLTHSVQWKDWSGARSQSNLVLDPGRNCQKSE